MHFHLPKPLHGWREFMERGQAEEVGAAATLGDLAFAGPISSDERRSDLKIVAKLDALDARLLFLAHKLLGDAREAGIASDPQVVRALLKQQRSYRGSCVRTGHSLNIGGP